MGRKKPEAVVINSEQEADKALAGIAEQERIISDNEIQMNEVIDKAKARFKLQTEPRKARIKELETALAAYANLNKAEVFNGKKSRELTFGVIGFRKSTKLLTKAKVKLAQVLENCKNLNLLDGVKVKESVNKEAMREWPDERLEAVGMRREESDVFFYEIKQESLEA